MEQIGIDVGGTSLKAGLVRPDGTIARRTQRPLQYSGGEAFAATLAEMAAEVAGDSPPGGIGSVGIGIPGAVDGGTVLHTENIPMRNLPLAQMVRKHLDLPVYLGNDADCAAVGEYLFGCGRGTRNFVLVTLGTGIGGGLILGGRLYRGQSCAGEVGCMVIDRTGDPGSWESLGSATGLIAMASRAREAVPESLLWSEALNGRTIFAAAERQDAAACAVIREYTACLGVGLTNLTDILMPDVIAVGGGVSAAPEQLLLEPVRQYVRTHCYGRHIGQFPRILRAELGNDAGIVGAALLGSVL